MDWYEFQKRDKIKNWIGGAWVEARNGDTLEVENPRYGKPFTSVVLSDSKDVEDAINAAADAFPSWRDTPIKERVQVLYKTKHLLEKESGNLSQLISHENGKTQEEAQASVAKTIECLEYGCAVPNACSGQQQYVSRGVTCSMLREPLGVVAGVTPFNFPLMVPMWMLPQALVSGNSFVLKPSEQVPVSVARLAEILDQAGLPKGVVNIVKGQKEAVEALTDHEKIKAMAFVGSTPVAKALYERGAKTGRPMLCLGSAKNHLIMVPDADPEMTSADVVRSFFGMAGQRCMAATVLVAVGNVDGIIERILAHAKAVKLGVDMGPLINAGSKDRITKIVDNTVQAGARVLLDGRQNRPETPSDGHWMGPVILDQVTPEMPSYTQEVFGPVMSIVRVDTLDEALAVENANPYGNGGSIYTSSGATARYASERINAAMTGINIGIPVPREPFSFGGWELSKFGHGDITGEDGYRFWTRPRKLTVKWGLQPDATWMS